MSNEFSTYLKECGIVPQLTPPGTPQWNGVSERRNRTLLDMVRSMMCQTELPLYFWSYALLTAAHTLNVVPSKSVEKTPHKLWMGKPPSITYLRIWGCEVYVKCMMATKLHPKADKCFIIGYPRETKGYSFWHKLTNTIFVKRGVVFLEKEFLKAFTLIPHKIDIAIPAIVIGESNEVPITISCTTTHWTIHPNVPIPISPLPFHLSS